MFYRITLDVGVTDKEKADKIVSYLRGLKQIGFFPVIKLGETTLPILKYQMCRHDEETVASCHLLREWKP